MTPAQAMQDPTPEEPTAPRRAPDEASDLEKQLARGLKVGLPIATVVGAVGAGAVAGAPLAVLVLAGGALLGVIATFWASVRTLLGETPLSGADAYAIAAPRAEEEQKRAVLRALKDLEFERSVGKISDEDYQALVAKYREEAKRLLRLLDEEAAPRRQQVEVMVAKRLWEEGLAVGDIGYRKAPGEARAPNKKRKKAQAEAAEAASARDCAACGTANDLDAVFCKKCGARVEALAEAEAAGAPAAKDEGEGAS
jgi:hypothetical protein